MNDQTRVLLSAVAGALAGAVVGFLLFTARGRTFRAELGPHLESIARELDELQQTVVHVRQAATDGWQRVEQFISELGEQDSAWGSAGESRSH